MIYSIFDPETKIIIGHITCSGSTCELMTQSRQDIVEGYYEIGLYQIVDGNIIEITPPNTIDLDSIQRNQRNELLGSVDRINPVWYTSLAPYQQTELAVYRQALLDVPQQTGFPTDVSWPAKPAWL